MKNTKLSFLTKALMIGVVTLGFLPLTSQPSHAREDRYYCGKLNGTPTTMMRTPREDLPLVQWLDRAFGSVWNPENRCDHVSKQFQAAYEGGEDYLTIGKKNGYDIICSAKVAGGNCQRQLLTIPKTLNSVASLDVLNRVMNGSTSAVLLNSPSIRSDYSSYDDGWNGELRPYLNLQELRRMYDN